MNQETAQQTDSKGILSVFFAFVIIAAILYGGFHYVQNALHSQTQNQSLSSLANPTKGENPTASWKPYITSILSFKYPPLWSIRETIQGHFLFVPAASTPLESIPITLKTEFTTQYDQIVLGYKKIIGNPSTQSVTIGEDPAIRLSGNLEGGLNQGTFMIATIINHQNKAVVLEYVNYKGGPNSTDQEMYELILTTIQFLEKNSSQKNKPLPNASPQTNQAPTTGIYKDLEIGYTITYPLSWNAKKTYGKDIQKLAPTDVVSGLEFNSPDQSASLILNVIDKKDAASIVEWWNKYSPYRSEGNPVSVSNTTFKNLEAIEKPYSPSASQSQNLVGKLTYFLFGNYIYLVAIEYQQGNTNQELQNMVNSITLPTSSVSPLSSSPTPSVTPSAQ